MVNLQAIEQNTLIEEWGAATKAAPFLKTIEKTKIPKIPLAKANKRSYNKNTEQTF